MISMHDASQCEIFIALNIIFISVYDLISFDFLIVQFFDSVFNVLWLFMTFAGHRAEGSQQTNLHQLST